MILNKAIRYRIFLVTTFPIALVGYWVVKTTFFGGGFLPFMILLLLGILTFAEIYSSFEIQRVNRLMNTDIIAPARPWYLSHFWSWDGARERLSSTKAWFAILYVVAAAFFSTLGVSLMFLFWGSLVVLIFALGIISPSNSNWVFELSEREVSGKLEFLIDPNKIQINFLGVQSIDSEIPNKLTWVYTSGWTIGFCVLFILLELVLIPILARHLRDVTENLLGTFAASDSFAAKLTDWLDSRKK
jgi:hypothetical protein